MPTEEIKKNINSLVAGDAELTANYAYLQSVGMNEQTCLSQLSLIAQLKSLMKTNVVEFEFEKISGEKRRAFGTRAEDVLNQNNGMPKGQRSSSAGTFPYYDIERKAWRCFKPQLLKSINLNYSL